MLRSYLLSIVRVAEVWMMMMGLVPRKELSFSSNVTFWQIHQLTMNLNLCPSAGGALFTRMAILRLQGPLLGCTWDWIVVLKVGEGKVIGWVASAVIEFSSSYLSFLSYLFPDHLVILKSSTFTIVKSSTFSDLQFLQMCICVICQNSKFCSKKIQIFSSANV